jgi:hypothetical protein
MVVKCWTKVLNQKIIHNITTVNNIYTATRKGLYSGIKVVHPASLRGNQ